MNGCTLSYFDPDNKANFRGGVCVCIEFQKKNICPCVVAMLCLENKYSIHDDFKVRQK